MARGREREEDAMVADTEDFEEGNRGKHSVQLNNTTNLIIQFSSNIWYPLSRSGSHRKNESADSIPFVWHWKLLFNRDYTKNFIYRGNASLNHCIKALIIHFAKRKPANNLYFSSTYH